MDTYLNIIEYGADALIYVLFFIIGTAGVLVVKDWAKHRSINKENSDLQKYIKPMAKYIRLKGVDDFIEECNMHCKKGYISIPDRARIDEKYKVLGELGANGEREAAYQSVKDLKPQKSN